MVLFCESTLTEFLIIFLFYLLYLCSKKGLDYWEKLGVKFNKPLPLIGNSANLIFPKKSFAEFLRDLYNQYPEEKIVGYYEFLTPSMILRDPETIRSIIIKDNVYFYDRVEGNDGELNPLESHLGTLKGQHWKIMRSKLSTVFTLHKLKIMLDELSACVDGLCRVLDKAVSDPTSPVVDINAAMKKLSLDITGSCVFGLRLDCLNDPNSEFVKRSSNAFTFSVRLVFSKLLQTIHHKLPKLLNFKERSKDVEDYFINFVKDAIRTRQVNNFRRNDFLQLMIDLRNEEYVEKTQNDSNEKDDAEQIFKKVSLMDDSIFAANIFVFLNAGTDTTGSALAFCLLELALNLDVQEKLYNEIKETLDKTGNNISYYDIRSLKYLEKVISEALRKYPVAGSFPRICTKHYKMPKSDIIIKEGVLVYVPIYGLHRDPKYYPDPEKFDPERFSEEAKRARQPCSYLPFGDGPRNCIGMRFALIVMKVTLVKVLSQFEFRVVERTKYPVEFSTRSMLLTSAHEIWLNVNKRKT